MRLPTYSVRLETERLVLRPCADPDFERAVPYYRDEEFLRLMEGEPPAEPVTAAYLRVAGESMAAQGYYFVIDHKADRRMIGEACLQWMNLERGRVKGERIVRVPIGIWDKGYWGKGSWQGSSPAADAICLRRSRRRPFLRDGCKGRERPVPGAVDRLRTACRTDTRLGHNARLRDWT